MKLFNINTNKQPVNERTLTRVVSLIVIACVLLLLTIGFICISLAGWNISLFEN